MSTPGEAAAAADPKNNDSERQEHASATTTTGVVKDARGTDLRHGGGGSDSNNALPFTTVQGATSSGEAVGKAGAMSSSSDSRNAASHLIPRVEAPQTPLPVPTTGGATTVVASSPAVQTGEDIHDDDAEDTETPAPFDGGLQVEDSPRGMEVAVVEEEVAHGSGDRQTGPVKNAEGKETALLLKDLLRKASDLMSVS